MPSIAVPVSMATELEDGRPVGFAVCVFHVGRAIGRMLPKTGNLVTMQNVTQDDHYRCECGKPAHYFMRVATWERDPRDPQPNSDHDMKVNQ